MACLPGLVRPGLVWPCLALSAKPCLCMQCMPVLCVQCMHVLCVQYVSMCQVACNACLFFAIRWCHYIWPILCPTRTIRPKAQICACSFVVVAGAMERQRDRETENCDSISFHAIGQLSCCILVPSPITLSMHTGP